MEFTVLKKKLNSFRGANGVFRGVSEELLVEVLRLWENYTGAMGDFAKKLGVRNSQLGPMIHKARKVSKNKEYANGKFKEVKIESSNHDSVKGCKGIDLKWDKGRVIRFPEVDQLIEFLKKVA